MSDSSFEDALSSIMGNEALMGKISSIMNSHGGSREDSLPEVIEAISSSLNDKSENSESKDKKDDAVSAMARGFKKNESTKLLQALRPYLSDKRAQMIDQFLKIEQLAEIMKLAR